jgi:hypothetical protein
MRSARPLFAVLLVLGIVVLARYGNGLGSASAQLGSGGISMQVTCGGQESITITNQTDLLTGLDLSTFRLRTIKTGREFTLSGTLQPGRYVTYYTGTAAAGGSILSTTPIFDASDPARDGAVLITPYGNLSVTCAQVNGILTTSGTPTATTTAGAGGSITLQIQCSAFGETIIIGNQTNLAGGLNLSGWKFRTFNNPTEYALSGQLSVGHSIIFRSGPGATGNVLSSSYLFDNTNPAKPDGGILISPFGTLIVPCAQATGSMQVGITPVSATGTPIASATGTVSATASATATSTATASSTAQTPVGQWLSSPPPYGQPQCPAASQWLLLYWAGATASIATSASACPNTDLFWVNRSGRWLGFAKAAPGASDTWESLTGEAHFAHGD